MGSYKSLLPKETPGGTLTVPLILPRSVSNTSQEVLLSAEQTAFVAGGASTSSTKLSEVHGSCLRTAPDIAKEALRITKQSLGSSFQLVPRGKPITRSLPSPTVLFVLY